MIWIESLGKYEIKDEGGQQSISIFKSFFSGTKHRWKYENPVVWVIEFNHKEPYVYVSCG